MANVFYDNYKDLVGGGGNHGAVDLDADTIKIILVDNADYTFSAAHEDLADVAAAGRVATGTLDSTTMGTVGPGIFDAADEVLTSVSGDPCESLIIYKDSGAEATSALIAYIDTASGLPITPNGNNITLVFPAGGIFDFG